MIHNKAAAAAATLATAVLTLPQLVVLRALLVVQ
jgi:hypothetical protein